MMASNNLLDYLQKDKATCYRYLLVDPLKAVRDDEPLGLPNLKGIFTDDEVVTVLRPDLSHEPSYCPHLILLANPNHDIEPELLALTQARSQREQKLYKHYI